MKRIIALIALLVSLVSCNAAQKNVLVLTERGGLHENFVAAGLDWLYALGEQEGFTVTEINNTEPMSKEYLEGFDLIIQLNYPPFAWTDEAAQSFIDYIEQGRGGWIGFHHASLLGEFDGYPLWEWASGFLGGIVYSNYIAELSDGVVEVEDSTHPVMAGVEPSFLVGDDEWYTYDKSPRPNVTVLAHVNEDTYTAETDLKMGDHPVIWINPAVKARNVYFQMGHSPELYRNDNFVKAFTNAINWTLGNE